MCLYRCTHMIDHYQWFYLDFYVNEATLYHHSDVIMSAMASLTTGVSIVCSAVCPGADVRGIRRWPMDSPHKGPVRRKMTPFDDVIMHCGSRNNMNLSIMIWQTGHFIISRSPSYIYTTLYDFYYICVNDLNTDFYFIRPGTQPLYLHVLSDTLIDILI